MLSCFSQLEFPVVSGQHTISKYKSLIHMSSYIYWCLFHVEPNLGLFHFHLTWKTVSISQCNIVSYLMESTGTGQVNVTCPVSSTLSWSAEFKHRNISANAVHVWGDWQHLKGHWVKRERQSWKKSENTYVNTEYCRSFTHLLHLQGVVEFALSAFFIKLVDVTFLFWLPKYISSGQSGKHNAR
jgi:hypothetical protein